MGNNKSLRKANKNKEDEFYTQLTDIEFELKHYKDFFENKTVLCNCDDPFESNFFKYFALNFNSLKFKKKKVNLYIVMMVHLYLLSKDVAIWVLHMNLK